MPWLSLRTEIIEEFSSLQTQAELDRDAALYRYRERCIAARTAASARYRDRMARLEPERWAEYKAKWNENRRKKRRAA